MCFNKQYQHYTDVRICLSYFFVIFPQQLSSQIVLCIKNKNVILTEINDILAFNIYLLKNSNGTLIGSVVLPQ